MSARKVAEAGELRRRLEAVNDRLPGPCCPFPQRCVQVEYTVAGVTRAAEAFVAPVVVAVEYHARGSRLFAATSRQHFPHWFPAARAALTELPTWDEILLPGRPVRLYLDLEFYRDAQPSPPDEAALTEELWQRLQAHRPQLHLHKFVLDATTESKFSQHWLVSGWEAGDASALGGEVKAFAASLPAHFYLRDKAGTGTACLVDTAVYGPAQNFRMAFSPKFGRHNVLLPRPLAHRPPEESLHEHCAPCEELLIASLAQLDAPWAGLDVHAVAQNFRKARANIAEPSPAPRQRLYELLPLASAASTNPAAKASLRDFRAFLRMDAEDVDAALQLAEPLLGLNYEDLHELKWHTAQLVRFFDERLERGKALLCPVAKAAPLQSPSESDGDASVGPKLSQRSLKTLSRLERVATNAGEAGPSTEQCSRLVESLPLELRRGFPSAPSAEGVAEELRRLGLDRETKARRRFAKARQAHEDAYALAADFVSETRGDDLEHSRLLVTSAQKFLSDLLHKYPQLLETVGKQHDHDAIMKIRRPPCPPPPPRWTPTSICLSLSSLSGAI